MGCDKQITNTNSCVYKLGSKYETRKNEKMFMDINTAECLLEEL